MNFRNLILGILLVCLVTVVFAPDSGRDSRGDSDYNTQYMPTIPTNLPENTIPIVKEIDLPAKELIPYSADTSEEREQESDVCKDSDGSNPGKSGSVEYYTLINGVKYNKNTIYDACGYGDLSVVHEAICNDGKGDYTTISCATGETCQGGKCTGTQTPEPEPECDANNDCAQTEYCSNGECVPVVEGECGYVSNHKWNDYECCANSDCSSNEECVEHKCEQKEEPEPECVADSDCSEGFECVNEECVEKEEPEPECITNSDCPSGFECKNGECKEKPTPTVSCTDSDGGENLFTLGSAQKSRNILQDTCYRGKLKEAVCIHNNPVYKILECGTGYECSAGVCVEEAPEPENECSVDSDCKDNEYCMLSATPGDNKCVPVVEGECGYVSNHKWNDYECCANSDCSSNEECVSHECKEKSTPTVLCTDSDGGEELFKFGKAQKGHSILPDTCYRGKVKEAVCIHNIPTYKILECKHGYECDTGVCVKEKPKDECTTNHDCANEEYCSLKSNGNKCLPVVEGECGYVDLHVWNEYECCEDSECSTGYDCSEHKCVLGEEAISLSCEDSDLGKTNFGFGVLTYTYSIENITYTENYHDTCVDESTVLEYYCSGKDYKTQEMGCPLTSVCSEGNCIEKEETPECTVDTDCSEGYTCTNGECIEKEEPEPECVTNTDCSEGYVCTNGECVEEIVTPECTSNEQCADDEYCMLGAIPENNDCVPVQEGECGYIANHQWNDYECCTDSDCSEGYACLVHECTDMDPWDDFFGYDVCTDSDNGFDVLVPGSTNHKHYLMGFVSLDESKLDECDPTDVTKIIEYGCDETKHIIAQTLSCGEGKACVTEEGASYCKEIPKECSYSGVKEKGTGTTSSCEALGMSEKYHFEKAISGDNFEIFSSPTYDLLISGSVFDTPKFKMFVWYPMESIPPECYDVTNTQIEFDLGINEYKSIEIEGKQEYTILVTDALFAQSPGEEEWVTVSVCEAQEPEEFGCAVVESKDVTFKIDNKATLETATVVLKEGEEVEMFGAKVKLIEFGLTVSCQKDWQVQEECSVDFQTAKFELSVADQSFEFNLPMGHIAIMENIWVEVADTSYTLAPCEPTPQIEYYTISLNKGWNMFSVPYSKVTLEGATGTCTEICSFTKENFWAFTEYIDPYGDYTQLLSSDELIGGTDYWFNAADDCEVNLPIVDNNFYAYGFKELKSGITSLGGPYDSVDVKDAFNSCNVVGLATYLNGAWVNSGITSLEPGNGYVVLVEGDCKMMTGGVN